ncbi:hypothetical protein Ahy_B04g073342 [Arachis hypogaea]|uniref:Transposase MuDR plant domain-containing protein n=1 Tax=Arachis hypogaea TaxID=3818 RepID=A0A444ZQ61_ARAHY|nr:hypothetical protein Ahy_B04g073342 [Arachis hypogaea]
MENQIARVKFVCENSLDVVIPFTISFEELKCVMCEKIDSERYPIPVFDGFVQFQTKYVTDEASMQEIFSMYIENRAQISFIELYIEFEQSEADRNIVREDYNSDSEEEFKSNYEVVGPDGDEDQCDGTMAPDVTDVANALANEVPFEEPSFMQVLDLEAMHDPKFPELGVQVLSIFCLAVVAAEIPIVADGEFAVGMEFSFREAVIKVIKEYTIRRSVDYRVYESEPLTFYAKCTQYGSGCDWLIRVSMISRKYCWVIRRYNGRNTYTRATISQDHSKLDLTTIAEAIKPMRSSKCARCQVDWSMLSISVANDVIVVDQIPCQHVFACCANQRLNWQVYVHDVYKMDQVRRVYRARFRPLVNTTTWPAYNGPRFVPNPYLRRVTKGRPKRTRFLNEMDTRMLRRPKQYRLCGAEKHSRSRCRQSAGANATEIISRFIIYYDMIFVALYDMI